MTPLFLSIYKVNTKLVTTMLSMALILLPFPCQILGPNFPFVMIITQFLSLKYSIVYPFMLLTNNQQHFYHFIVLIFSVDLFTCILLNVKISFPCIVYVCIVMIMINFNGKKLLYIDGNPCTHGNIVGFIDHCKCSLFGANSLFLGTFL